MALNSRFLDQLAARRRFGMKPGLETIRAILHELGDPQDALRVVHVAGTNGKGAVAAMLDAVFRASGLRVGRYTSPHLVSLNERFFLDGAPAADAALDAAAAVVFPVVERLEREKGLEVTFFECLTALAFLFYAREKVDVLVLETGLGGRLDATNVVRAPLVSVITRIGFDHCDVLGSSCAAIAEEKAGIVKPGCPVVAGAMPVAAKDTIARVASLVGAPYHDADDHVSVVSESPLVVTTAHLNLPPMRFALFGAFQVENAVTALAVLDVIAKRGVLEVPAHAVVKGFEGVVWPGRCQRVAWRGTDFIVDGAHNPDGAMALKETIKPLAARRPACVVCGFCGDKDVLANLRIMSAVSSVGWTVPIRSSRSLEPVDAAERMRLAGFVSATPCATLEEALDAARAWAAETNGFVVVWGSLFLVGEALVALDAFPWEVRAPDANELTLTGAAPPATSSR